MALLYDAVAAGMWAYTRAAFRVTTLHPERLRIEPRTILATTHRRETDVPLVCPSLFYGGGLHRDRSRRMSFASRGDLVRPGFFAGFPGGLHPRLRRTLYRVEIAEYLQGLTLYPVRSAARLCLADVVRDQPGLELDALPEELVGALRRRAEELGLPEPRVGADVDRGEFADLLRPSQGRDVFSAPELEPAWRRQAAAATRDFRSLVELMRRGGVLLLFPEGRPSPDGEIGPLQRGLEALVRRGRPAWIQPTGIAYDPLTCGRAKAFVSFETPFAAREDAVEATLAALKLAVPLTCGQVVATALLAGSRATAEVLDEAVETARAEGRSIDPELVAPAERRRCLAEAVAAACRRPRGELEVLAREYRSAREP